MTGRFWWVWCTQGGSLQSLNNEFVLTVQSTGNLAVINSWKAVQNGLGSSGAIIFQSNTAGAANGPFRLVVQSVCGTRLGRSGRVCQGLLRVE